MNLMTSVSGLACKLNRKSNAMRLIIDCDPFLPRPDLYARYVYEHILEREYQEPISKFFGAWTWPHIDVSETERRCVGEYLKRIYAEGKIRYAEW